MICLELNWLFYYQSWMLQLSEFVWALHSSAWVVFNNFLLIDATDRSNISSDQKRLIFAVSLYPLSFFANTPFKTGSSLKYFHASDLWLNVAIYPFYCNPEQEDFYITKVFVFGVVLIFIIISKILHRICTFFLHNYSGCWVRTMKILNY